jgi:RNA polymerase sigma-70 factor (ECF subfamily)
VQHDHSQRDGAERGDTARDGRRSATAGGLRQTSDRASDAGGAPRDDAQLIDAALAGQTASFGELVTKYQDRLYNSVLHVIGSADEAYDVVQDAFVQAFVKLESFSRQAAFYTWLYRIAFNLAVSRRRRQRPVVSVERTKELTGEEPLGRDDAPGARLQRQEQAATVQTALAALAEEYRTVIVLREIDGYDYETIGEILDLPVGTVRSRLHRARTQLREQLKSVLLE